MLAALGAGLLVVLLAAGCARRGTTVTVRGEQVPERLADWNVVRVHDGALVLSDGVLPYDLNTPLFSDYALKLRTVWMPPGTSAGYEPETELDFPVGTVFSKTFLYPLAPGSARSEGRVARRPSPRVDLEHGTLPIDGFRLVETRILARRDSGWIALAYVWNDQQTEARLEIAGDERRLTLVSDDGGAAPFSYVVPDVNQCAGCHATNHTDRQVRPIGPKARHLNRDFPYEGGTENQLSHWTRIGYLHGLEREPPRMPDAFDPNDGTLEQRARAYLDINCGHCHNPRGAADTSGLLLDHTSSEPRHLGVCKPPVAAGRGSGDRLVSIDPGHPERSIMVFRMASTDPGIAMPELGRATVHQEGVALLSDWIRSLAGGCQELVAGSVLGP